MVDKSQSKICLNFKSSFQSKILLDCWLLKAAQLLESFWSPRSVLHAFYLLLLIFFSRELRFVFFHSFVCVGSFHRCKFAVVCFMRAG